MKTTEIVGEYLVTKIDGVEVSREINSRAQAMALPALSVAMWQARAALQKNGMLVTVDAAIAALSGDFGDIAKIQWNFASTVERDNPLISSMQKNLGLSDEQIDELFAYAATL
jgi:hypothetical protein